ncbi:CAP domain-containing protein [Shouchella shacheensis]|uniref:CAP domain-containing protein n=1 Tax=Shouchella shacheensis TaxID=1649580 RepID=UPI00073FC55F|nr:CAP domain-containing protein [Shouchella shacheensis]
MKKLVLTTIAAVALTTAGFTGGADAAQNNNGHVKVSGPYVYQSSAQGVNWLPLQDWLQDVKDQHGDFDWSNIDWNQAPGDVEEAPAPEEVPAPEEAQPEEEAPAPEEEAQPEEEAPAPEEEAQPEEEAPAPEEEAQPEEEAPAPEEEAQPEEEAPAPEEEAQPEEEAPAPEEEAQPEEEAPAPEEEVQPEEEVTEDEEQADASGDITAEEQQMVDSVNQERQQAGLAPLHVDTQLTEVARVKAQDMIDNNYFSHNSPTYGSPFDMMDQFGVQYNTAGENLAGNQTVDAAHQALMNSQGHRENILSSNYTEVGIGIVDGGPYGKMFVQLFKG